MKKQLNIPTKEEAPTKICPDSFTLHPAPCTLPPEKGFTPLERKPWYLWWIERSYKFKRSLKPCPNSLTGFTLLELLVSISILSVVLVMIYGTLSIGSRAWEKGEEDIERIQRMRVVMNLLSREIKSTFPYKVTPSELDTHKEFYAFEGKKDSVSFVSTVPLKGGKKGLSWLSFWVESEEGLVVVERDALRSDIFKERNNIDKDEIEVLDSHVTAMKLEYYELRSGKEEGEGEGEWKEHWDAEKEGTLPHAVRIELTFEEEGKGEEDESELYYRELIVPLMIYSKKIRKKRSDQD